MSPSVLKCEKRAYSNLTEGFIFLSLACFLVSGCLWLVVFSKSVILSFTMSKSVAHVKEWLVENDFEEYCQTFVI